jgi:hypothetical protein
MYLPQTRKFAHAGGGLHWRLRPSNSPLRTWHVSSRRRVVAVATAAVAVVALLCVGGVTGAAADDYPGPRLHLDVSDVCVSDGLTTAVEHLCPPLHPAVLDPAALAALVHRRRQSVNASIDIVNLAIGAVIGTVPLTVTVSAAGECVALPTRFYLGAAQMPPPWAYHAQLRVCVPTEGLDTSDTTVRGGCWVGRVCEGWGLRG